MIWSSCLMASGHEAWVGDHPLLASASQIVIWYDISPPPEGPTRGRWFQPRAGAGGSSRGTAAGSSISTPTHPSAPTNGPQQRPCAAGHLP